MIWEVIMHTKWICQSAMPIWEGWEWDGTAHMVAQWRCTWRLTSPRPCHKQSRLPSRGAWPETKVSICTQLEKLGSLYGIQIPIMSDRLTKFIWTIGASRYQYPWCATYPKSAQWLICKLVPASKYEPVPLRKLPLMWLKPLTQVHFFR